MKITLYFVLLMTATLLANVALAQSGNAPRRLTTTGGEQQLAQLVISAPLIVEGRAGESRSFWDAEHREIYTATPITLYKVFKGEPVGGPVEVIVKGGQVGNSASSCKDCRQVGLGLQPTGIFFLEPVPHVDPKATGKVAYRVFNGLEGFLEYDSYLRGGANTQSRWQLYPRVEASLYPVLTGLTRQPYQVVKPFDPKTFNAFREKRQLDSLMYSRMAPAENAPRPMPAAKKKISTSASEDASLLQPQAVTISSFFPTTITAGTFDSLTINGSGFGTPNSSNPSFKPIVRFVNADAPNATINTPALNIIRFTNTKIVLYVPSNDGSTPGTLGHGAASGVFRVVNASLTDSADSPSPVIIPRSELTLNYVSPLGVPLNPQAFRQLRLTNRDGSGGMRFKYDANLRDARSGATIQAVEATIRKWRCETLLNLGDDVMQTVPFSQDSVNCNIAYVPGNTLDTDVLMATTHKFSYCQNSAGTFVYITAIDIAVNKDIPWSYDLSASPIPTDSTRYDFKTIMLHELGHGIGLDHVADTAACMYPYIPPFQQRYYLSTEPELNGGANILHRSTSTGRCYTPMVALTSTTCTGAQLSLTPSMLTSCDGGTVTLTASGATSYVWGPLLRFNPPHTTASVTTSNDPTLPIIVYGIRDGLGDVAQVEFANNVWCPPTPTSSDFRTTSTSVYPNPATTDLTIDYQPTSQTSTVNISLHDNQGTRLRTFTFTQNSQRRLLPIHGLRPGLYIVRTVENGKVSSIHVQVQ